MGLTSDELLELRNDILREMYAAADPPLDFDEVLADPESVDDDWFQQHELSAGRQRAIFDEHVQQYDLSNREHTQLAMACITHFGPTTPDGGSE